MDEKELEHLAKLARLTLTPEEREKFYRQIQEVLAHIQRIEALSLPGQVEYFFPNQEVRPLRPDVVQPGFSQEEALANAPEKEGDFFIVPRVVKE